MADRTKMARGPALAALVLLFLPACAPPDAPAPPPPRSLLAAESALRGGNLASFRAQLGKGPGIARHGNELATRLDPQAWLIAMGADEREHDLVAAMTSMRAGDDAALETALGFGPQDLATTVFNAGASVFARRAGGRNYYESGPQPLDLLDDGPTPTLPEGFLVMAVTLWGSVDGREFRVDYAFDESGLVNLDGVLWQATTSMEIPPRAARYPDPQHALPGWAGKLAVEGLLKPAYWGAKFRLVAMDGTLQRIELGRDERGWALCDGSNTSLQERLGSLRDERLEFIRRRANDFRRTSGRWPRGLHELTFAAKQLSDPTSDLGRLGWADYEASPAVGFEVAPDEAAEYAAACTQTGPAGRRAIRRDGSYFWLEP